jgi:hypothetical protein
MNTTSNCLPSINLIESGGKKKQRIQLDLILKQSHFEDKLLV